MICLYIFVFNVKTIALVVLFNKNSFEPKCIGVYFNALLTNTRQKNTKKRLFCLNI